MSVHSLLCNTAQCTSKSIVNGGLIINKLLAFAFWRANVDFVFNFLTLVYSSYADYYTFLAVSFLPLQSLFSSFFLPSPHLLLSPTT